MSFVHKLGAARIAVAIALVFMQLPNATACDACGCIVSSVGPGLVQLVPRHVVGVHYQYSHYRVRPYSNDLVSHQQLQMAALGMRFHLSDRFRLVAELPFQHRSIKVGEVQHSRTGLGDMSVSALVSVLPEVQTRRIKHALQLGLGAKLPTGSFKFTDDPTELFLPALQTGTGTFDYFTQVFYVAQNERYGLQLSGSARLTTENSDRYKYGNQAQAELRAFHRIGLGKSISLIPAVGILADAKRPDMHRAADLTETGGHVAYAVIALDLIGKHGAISAQVQPPVLNRMDDPTLQIYPRAAVSAQVFIDTKRRNTPKINLNSTNSFPNI